MATSFKTDIVPLSQSIVPTKPELTGLTARSGEPYAFRTY